MESARCKPPQEKVSTKARLAAEDTVKVFCRIKPLQNDVSCAKVRSNTAVSLHPPEAGSSHRLQNDKEIRHSFSYVFNDKATQKEVFDHVALPLVKNLIDGKNGLIFAYGVTGSGKTFTMTGKPEDGGIVPRCLDVIFNSISSYQAAKYVFTPDRINGFYIQSETDAIAHGHCELNPARSLRTQKKRECDADFSQRIADDTKIESVKGNSTYAIFVSYVEIYNNSVYDLLGDVPKGAIKSNQLKVKNIREDAYHNMYVHSVTEVEVKSAEEAFEAFCKGQKRKRMAITTLNSESSRSHSVFNIRLVQASLYSQGETGLENMKAACVSQLSLVDLAGSERTNRTKSIGQRLREAGNINNSLMTLRTCLEILRDNQLCRAKKVVPYRDSKMTLLFKRFFEGEGQVEMIVCLNPSVKEYAETIHVMKFSEMTQEVQMDFVLPPVRKKSNIIFKNALQKMEENSNGESEDIDHSTDRNNTYEKMLPKFIMKKDFFVYWLKNVQDYYIKFQDLEEEKEWAEHKWSSLRTAVEQERDKSIALENRLESFESGLMNMEHQVKEKEADVLAVKQELQY